MGEKNTAGMMAREMAAAPLPAKRVNRFDRLFGSVLFTAVDARVYGDDGDRKSKKVADVRIAVCLDGVEIPGAYFAGKIDAVQAAGAKVAVAEFRILGNRQGAAFIVGEDPVSIADWTEYRGSVLNRFMLWREKHGGNTASVPTDAVVLEGLTL